MLHSHLPKHVLHFEGMGACALPHGQCLFDGELAGQATGLQHDAHFRADLAAVGGGVFVEDGDLAGACARETFDDFQRGGFAGAIGAEQSVDLAAVDVEVEIIHCLMKPGTIE